MNDYKTALKEYQELQYIIKNQLNDMLFLLDKANSFKSGMISIEEHINLSQGNSSDEYFFINPIFNNYSQEIHKIFLSYDEQITIPLKNFIENFTFATNNSLNSFNQIKLSLIESKQKVIKARDDYYNYCFHYGHFPGHFLYFFVKNKVAYKSRKIQLYFSDFT